MFKHILIPTDGSRLAAKGVKAGVKLARALGARVTGVYVMSPYLPPMYGEAAIYVAYLSPQEYRKITLKAAKKALALVDAEARKARVRCSTLVQTEVQPWKGILRAARARRADTIAIASHGRGGLGGLILGSETQQVLARSKIPVLVAR